MTVAALFIDPRGPYPKMAGVDAWDESRDAMTYAGPHAIVAHPPCGPWGQLRHLYRGNEHRCAPHALDLVRRFGGVLEHPAHSKLWYESVMQEHHGRFGVWTDRFGGYCIAVDQVEFGHVARKPTWLYLVGVPRSALEAPPFPGRKPTHWVAGRHKPYPRAHGHKPGLTPAHIKICSAEQRRRTPPLFAAYLVRLASAVRGT